MMLPEPMRIADSWSMPRRSVYWPWRKESATVQFAAQLIDRLPPVTSTRVTTKLTSPIPVPALCGILTSLSVRVKEPLK